MTFLPYRAFFSTLAKWPFWITTSALTLFAVLSRLAPSIFIKPFYNGIPRAEERSTHDANIEVLEGYINATSKISSINWNVALVNIACITYITLDIALNDTPHEDRKMRQMQQFYYFMDLVGFFFQHYTHAHQADLKKTLVNAKVVANTINNLVNGLESNVIKCTIVEKSYKEFKMPIIKLTIHDPSKYNAICNYFYNRLYEHDLLRWPVFFNNTDRNDSNAIYIVLFPSQSTSLEKYLNITFNRDLREHIAGVPNNIPARPPAPLHSNTSATGVPSARNFVTRNHPAQPPLIIGENQQNGCTPQ